MINNHLFFGVILISTCLYSCNEINEASKEASNSAWKTERIYSNLVKDTFNISVQYPKEFHQDSLKNYPVVVLIDADLYFPLLAPIVHQYEEVGIWPAMILAGVGYGSLQRMDSLRNRDYLYPEALASDEISTPGGGENFYQFLTQELLPKLEKDGITNAKRILAGHSFGGYFSLYSSLRQAELQRYDFAGFIAASPSLWYRDFYLEKRFGEHDNLGEHKIFLSIGGAEDAEWSLKPFDQLLQILEPHAAGKNVHSQVYAGLGHMDVAMVSFLQGIGLFISSE